VAAERSPEGEIGQGERGKATLWIGSTVTLGVISLTYQRSSGTAS
jgi:hypothetical protein